MFAKDQDLSASGYVESLVAKRLGEPTPEDIATYTPPTNSPKIGQASEPVTKPKRPTVNQPKPEPKPAEADDDGASELKHYVKPIQFF